MSTAPSIPSSKSLAKRWVVTACLAVLCLAMSGFLLVRASVNDAPGGTTPSGVTWGSNLGAQVDQTESYGIDNGQVAFVANNQDGWLYAAADNDRIRRYDASDLGSYQVVAEGVYVRQVKATVDGERIVALLDDGSVKSYGVGDDGELSSLGSARGPWSDSSTSFAISPAGDIVYVSDSNTAFLYALDLDSGELLSKLPSIYGSQLAVNPVSGLLYAQDDGGSLVGYAPRDLSVRTTGDGCVPGAVSADGTTLFCIDTGNTIRGKKIRAVDGETLSEKFSLKATGEIEFLAAGPTADDVYAVAGNGVDVFNAERSTPLTHITLPGGQHFGDSLTVGADDGRHVYVGPLLALDSRLVSLDISATRTNWIGLIFLVFGLLLVPALAAVATATSPRWRAALAASRDRSRQARIQREQNRAAATQLQGDERRATQIREWQRAYALTNGGALPPAGAMPPGFDLRAAERTNTLAILALVFGFGGGLLGIVFGHMALGQIERTGERGRGLAIAGLIFGYGGLLIGCVILVIYIAALSNTGLL